jgi:hypothetical protein
MTRIVHPNGVTEYLWGRFADADSPKYPPEFRTDMAPENCRICERLFGEHSPEEFETCMDQIFQDAERRRGWI